MIGKVFRIGNRVSRYAMWAQLGLVAATYVARKIRENRKEKGTESSEAAANLP